MEGQVFTLEVKDSRRNSAEKQKADAEVYSVVAEIVSVNRNIAERPSLHSPNHESFNHESEIRNHPIKQSTNQVGQQGDSAQGP